MSYFRQSRCLRLFAMTCSLVLCHAFSVSHGQKFEGLGFLTTDNQESYATSLSADGSVVVGHSRGLAFRWTSDSGIVGLGGLSAQFPSSIGFEVSADGNVIVGNSYNDALPFRWDEAALWTSSGGWIGLGALTTRFPQSTANGVSADGLVVVGYTRMENPGGAFRWTSQTGMVSLASQSSNALAASGDGSVIVGFRNTNQGTEGFRWTAQSGMAGLGDLPFGSFYSLAKDVSADGSVVVGSGTNYIGPEAVIWSNGGGPVGIGYLPGGAHFNRRSSAEAVSADGTTVVGSSTISANTFSSEAFVWRDGLGMLNIKDILINQGIEGLEGWRLGVATDVSADGRIIVGNGFNPQGNIEAWRADISGLLPDIAILPTTTVPVPGSSFPLFEFVDVASNQWFDPPTAEGFIYTMTDGSLFTSILDFPPGFENPFFVSVNDQILGQFSPGQSVDFVSLLGAGVTSFKISGISPLVDPEDPLAFPLKLAFSTPRASFTMQAVNAVPEASSLLFLSAAVGLIVLIKRQASGRQAA